MREKITEIIKNYHCSHEEKDCEGCYAPDVCKNETGLATDAILALIEDEMPKEKQVRYENIERRMGRDGKISIVASRISYNQEESGWNNCLKALKERLEIK
jgi:hypothetical protein